LRPARLFAPRRFLPFAFFCFLLFSFFCFTTGLLAGATGGDTFPTPVNDRLPGVKSTGLLGAIEHEFASHSVGRGGGGENPPSTRAS
jgi:hypothetical protein